MKLILCTRVDRYEGKPLYTVTVEDIDTPVNFHSYDCVYLKQGYDYDALIKEAESKFELEYTISKKH